MTYGVRGPFGPVLEMRVRTRELTGGKVVVVIVTKDHAYPPCLPRANQVTFWLDRLRMSSGKFLDRNQEFCGGYQRHSSQRNDSL